ncbi:hypothetical protein PALI_a0263 [Pseudoalteromonas aliena SW19]|uniref:Uncharacterized protein n=1 Tax=Pseudoalteromonas aliena SW19 TaxID=1314866 RepID=A0ABR9DXT6_9GAMM|nr:hypothetical protein [Pseudoalteromonas aliena SW19]
MKTVGLNSLIGFYYSTLFFGAVALFVWFEVNELPLTTLQVLTLMHICGIVAYTSTKLLGFKSIGLGIFCSFAENKAAIVLAFIFCVLTLFFSLILF